MESIGRGQIKEDIAGYLGETCGLLVYDMASESFESFQDANETLVRFCGLKV